MQIEIPDEWLIKLLNAGPRVEAKEAVQNFYRSGIDRQYIFYYIGEFVCHQVLIK